MKENSKLDLDIQSFDIKEYLYKIISYWKLFAVMIFASPCHCKNCELHFGENL
jgi:hypothetical protein